MTLPHRAAVLALALLGLAAYANAAACTNPGTLKLNLMTSSVLDHNLAKCLSSMTLTLATVDTTCQVTLTPLADEGSFVPSLWSSNPSATYTQLKECPTAAATATDADQAVALVAAVNKAIYGTTVNTADVTTVALAAGLVTLTKTGTNAVVITYAIVESTVAAAGVSTCAASGGTFATADNCRLDLTTDCPAGTYGAQISGMKVCAKCPAGTYGNGNGDGCTPCPAGQSTAGQVGQSSCGNCAAGTYAQGGNSDCLPCPAGSYSAATAGTCTECPAGSWSWYPGSTHCLRCIKGVPTCAAGNNGAACTDSGLDDASPGWAVLGLTTAAVANLKSGLTAPYASYNPALFGSCLMTTEASTFLSVFVDYDCSVEILPMTENACSEPGSAAYNYNALAIHGYYKSVSTIATLMPSQTGSTVDSYLMTFTGENTNDLTAVLWAASTNPATANTILTTAQTKTGTFTVEGGQVALKPAVADVNCPAGSYVNAAASSCVACPAGSSCGGGESAQAVECPADQYNPYVGKSSCTTCATCRATGSGTLAEYCPDSTSALGDAYCTLPWIDVTCGGGQEYDDSSFKCEACPIGTARDAPGQTVCTACLAGTIAATTGSTTCDACTGNQVAAEAGLSECVSCPVGSIANAGFTTCTACGPGTYAADGVVAGGTCTACPAGYYRSGDASPENNKCKPIPAGYRERKIASDTGGDPTGTHASLAKSEIVPCEKGTYSSWNGDPSNPLSPVPRTPVVSPGNEDNSKTCSPCTGKSYAPRTGMQKCLACKAGTVPIESAAGLLGPDACASCKNANDVNHVDDAVDHLSGLSSYRDAYTDQNTCKICPAGRETGPSNYAACTLCRPGTVMPPLVDGVFTQALDDTCAECNPHNFQSQAGKYTCNPCAAGSEAPGSGNIACSKCAKGWYNPFSATACVMAPAGSYVNTTGAITYTPCDVGHFSDEKGSDWCDKCPPGQYANTRGSKACKTCPAGTYSAGAASSCKVCAQGYYAPSGSSICSPCKAGYYTKATKSATCDLCPKGSQCPLLATKTPTACKIGYYSNKEGNKLCSPCPVNYYQGTEGSTECIACTAGTSTRGLTGQSKCQAVRSLRLAMF